MRNVWRRLTKSSVTRRLADQQTYTELLKESSSITPIVEKYREYKSALQQAAEAEELLGDREMHELAKEDLAQAQQAAEQAAEELKLLCCPRTPTMTGA